MTSDQRQRLKQIVDAETRARITAEDAPFGVDRCAGCGCHLDDYVTGCQKCSDRRSGRKRRKEARERREAFTGRCQLCGGQTKGTYCTAHDWAAV